MLQIQTRNNNMRSASASVSMGLLTKVQTLKYSRDYSFLLSEDAEVPLPTSNSQPENGFPPKLQAAAAAKLPVKGLTLAFRTSASTGDKNVGVPAAARSGVSAMQKPAVSSKLHLQVRVPVSKQPLSRKGETQESRNKKPTAASRLPTTSAMQKPAVPSRLHPPVSNQPLISRKGQSQEPRNPTAASSLPHKSAMQLSRIGEIQEPRKPTAASSLPSKSAMQKPVVPSRLHRPVSKQSLSRNGESQEPRKPTAASSLTSKSAVQKPAVPSKLHLAVPQQSLIRKGEILLKQQVPRPSSKPKITQSQPLAKSSVRPMAVDDQRPKKRPRSHDDDEKEDLDHAISEIRKMFGYNPRKYVGDEDDDRNMEANFQDILREERRSARIAGKEDREELRKIQEEERRERLQKEAKKRKTENRVN